MMLDWLKKKLSKEVKHDPTMAEKMQNSKEPWVNVITCDVNKDNPKEGYFELEWNPAFVKHLIKANYYGPTPEAVVDQWFTELCTNVSLDGQAQQSAIADGNRVRTNEKTLNQA
jgi:hypothetical protein